MGIFSAVACNEVAGTSRETGDIHSGFNCSVNLQCKWSDRLALMDDILGTPKAWPKITSGLTPYAVSASAQPFNLEYVESGQECGYTGDAIVTVNYSTFITEVASESLEPSTDYQQLDYQRFRWGNGNTGIPLFHGENIPWINRRLDIVRTRYRLPAVPSEYLTCLGKVNAAPYASALLGLTFPMESLLFQPQSASRSFTNLTASGWTVTIRFSCNPVGWNKFWNVSTQSYENIYLTGQGNTPYKPYPVSDFSALFA